MKRTPQQLGNLAYEIYMADCLAKPASACLVDIGQCIFASVPIEQVSLRVKKHYLAAATILDEKFPLPDPVPAVQPAAEQPTTVPTVVAPSPVPVAAPAPAPVAALAPAPVVAPEPAKPVLQAVPAPAPEPTKPTLQAVPAAEAPSQPITAENSPTATGT